VHRLLFVFVDGVGLATAGPANPLAALPTPALRGLLGGPLVREAVQEGDGLLLAPLDACLGVPGLPQSATGQTTLFTGVNAARHMGRHVTAFPGPRLQAILGEASVLRRAVDAGHAVTFANPFTDAYFEQVDQRRRRHSATTWAALAADLPLRGREDLLAGRAVAWDVVRDRFSAAVAAAGEAPVPTVAPRRAGEDLARLAAAHHLTLWETFLPDLAGHHRFGITAAEAVERLDGLLGGVLAARPPDVTLLLTSDHGNLEDATHRRHTRNPVPLLAVGPAARRFACLASIEEVAGRVLEVLASGTAADERRD
jgi:hypothetical protein